MRLATLCLVSLLALAPVPAAADESRCTADVVSALRRSSAYDAGRDVPCRFDNRLGQIESGQVLEGLNISQDLMVDQGADPIGEAIDALERPPAPDLSTSAPRPRFTSAPDGLGGFILRDQAGRTYAPPTDSQGNSTFYTDDGQIMRCNTSDAGVTTCD